MTDTNSLRSDKMHLYGPKGINLASRACEQVDDTIIRAVVMGSAGVGKTTLIKQCLYREFVKEYKATIEDTFSYEGDNFELEILDTSGSYNFPDMMKLAIQDGDIFILVFSVDEYVTFDRVGQLRKEIIDLRGADVPIIVVGNKSDSVDREMPYALADSIASIEWGCSYHDVTAKDADVTCDVFNDVLDHYPSLYGEKICAQNKDEVAIRKHERKGDKRIRKLRNSLSSLAKKIQSIRQA